MRGEVWINLEPIYGNRPDIKYSLSMETAGRRALQEAALYYSAMIYGWSFHYDIGKRTRGKKEDFDIFEPMGEVRWGDARLTVTEVETRVTKLWVWTDYRMSDLQAKRIQMWKTGTVRNVQVIGYCPITGPTPDSGWLEIRNAVLKDAARAAVRGMLRGSERNRPKERRSALSALPLLSPLLCRLRPVGRLRPLPRADQQNYSVCGILVNGAKSRPCKHRQDRANEDIEEL